MPRTIFKGSISFGLVNINIELYPSAKEHTFGFRLLHAKDHTPIEMKRWCPHDNKEVPWDEIVKGLKLKDDTYFIITPENLKKLRPQKTDNITITEFIDSGKVPAIYYSHHYYVLPGGKNAQTFYLFHEALRNFNKAALGTFVMREKEHICMIEPFANVMVLTILYYAYEVLPIPETSTLKLPEKVNKKELDLAQLLMSKLYTDKFDISEYKDTFIENLLKNIMAAKKGKLPPKPIEKKKPTKEVPSLMDTLKASLEKYKSKPKKAKKK